MIWERNAYSPGREKEEVKEDFGSTVKTENLEDAFYLSMSRDTTHFIWEPISLHIQWFKEKFRNIKVLQSWDFTSGYKSRKWVAAESIESMHTETLNSGYPCQSQQPGAKYPTLQCRISKLRSVISHWDRAWRFWNYFLKRRMNRAFRVIIILLTANTDVSIRWKNYFASAILKIKGGEKAMTTKLKSSESNIYCMFL